MSVRVQLPPLLRGLAGGERWVSADGRSIGAVLADLGRRNPSLALHFFDEQGAIRHNIAFVHRGEIVRAKVAAGHELAPGDDIVITNMLAGG